MSFLVSLQLLALCSVGIPVGMVLGTISAQGITTAATGIFNPDLFMAQTQGEVAEMIAANSGSKVVPLLAGALITLTFAFAAALPAARYASKVSPTTAMTGKIVTVKRKKRKTSRIRNFEAFYARMNMNRNRGRSAITILSLVMSITVFVALQSSSTLLDASANIVQMHLGDYSLTNQTAGFSREEIDTLLDTPGIESVSTLKYSLYVSDEAGSFPGADVTPPLQPGEAFHIAGIDEQRLSSMVFGLSDKDWDSLKKGTGCIVKNPIALSFNGENMQNTSFSVGDTITVNGKTMTILGILDSPVILENEGFVNGVQVIVSDNVYDQLTGQNQYTEIYPTLTNDADRESVEQSIKALCKRTGGTWFSFRNTDRQLQESYEQIKLLAWGLILFVGVIGILNIINTVYTNIHTRITEIGVQRAIGMSAQSLYKTFLWEGAYYGIIASVIGAVLGYLCTIFVNAASSDTLELVAVPLLPIAEAAILSLAACLIATCIPLRKISRLSIVEAMEAPE